MIYLIDILVFTADRSKSRSETRSVPSAGSRLIRYERKRTWLNPISQCIRVTQDCHFLDVN